MSSAIVARVPTVLQLAQWFETRGFSTDYGGAAHAALCLYLFESDCAAFIVLSRMTLYVYGQEHMARMQELCESLLETRGIRLSVVLEHHVANSHAGRTGCRQTAALVTGAAILSFVFIPACQSFPVALALFAVSLFFCLNAILWDT